MKQLTEPQKQWIAALRSGQYKQAKNILQYDDGYCCLGVACMVAKDNGITVRTEENGNIYGSSLESQPSVREWLGLASNNGHLKNGYNRALTCLNDSYGMSFIEIADHIEEYAEELFI